MKSVAWRLFILLLVTLSPHGHISVPQLGLFAGVI